MTREPHDALGANGTVREHQVARTFVELADTLVDEFDLTDFLHMLVDHCVDLLDVTAAGVMLSDGRGNVRMAAASSERSELLALFAADTGDGPCIDCVSTGRPVTSSNLAADAARWPRFAGAAEACGFASATALPMRLRREVIGALALLDTEVDGVNAVSTRLGQALADVATIGILQQRAVRHAELVTEQLQSALNSRVIIEQAKGVLSERSGLLSIEQAFGAMRAYARAHSQRLSELAKQVVDGTADIPGIVAQSVS
ncbi:GAF and ANTAR domain-containing protein [Actinokineospora sp. HUAS TT18]|uniref:GAF and ANTAR domain-containing protein n=1 Tax=Actinokineospora sp. HUAS TT18 TaxID=3447451 RepID=UPI003F51C55D